MPRWLHFGPYRLDAANRVLFREDTPVPVAPKAIEILRVLVQADGSVVTKEALLEEVWATTFVAESSITKNISELRSVLDDGAAGRQYIETFPRRGYRFSVPVRPVAEESTRRSPGRTLSVLPFRLLGPVRDPSAGARMADALTTRLATAKSFRVRCAGPADWVLEGSVQECGDTFRVNARLLESRSRTALWGDTFDQPSGNFLAAIHGLAEEIAGALVMFENTGYRPLLLRRYTESAAAYQAYLRGRFHWSRRSPAGLRAAIRQFREALSLDPEYAPAFSGLAATYALMPMLTNARARDYMPKARAAAARALDIDESLVEAHTAMAFVRWHYEFDWPRAEREFRLALGFWPDHAVTRMWNGLLLAEMDRGGEAIAEMLQAQALEPDSPAIRANAATVYYLAGRYREGLETARQAIARDPESLRAHWVAGVSLHQLGRTGEAIACLEAARRWFPDSPLILGSLGHASAAAGLRDCASNTLAELRRRCPRRCFFQKALVELGLEHPADSIRLLDQARQDREFEVVLLRTDPRFACLRHLPGFQEMVRKIWRTSESEGSAKPPGLRRV